MNKPVQYWQQWRALKAWERHTLIRLALMFPMAWIGLRLLGFNRMRRLVEGEQSSSLTSVGGREEDADLSSTLSFLPGISAQNYAQRCAQLTAIAARHGLYQANCLPQVLVLCRWLRQKKFPAQLKIGVKPNAQVFMAHAWVELEGIPLGQVVREYRAFEKLTPDCKNPSMP